MDFITIADRLSGKPLNIAYEDHGSGTPVVLIHGWPLSKEMWEHQVPALVNAGLRVITYDRRGFGHSSRTWDGYDYDTLATDLQRLIEHLDLREVALVGFSMGGGEVVRYCSKFLADRVAKAVFISSVTPFRMRTDENPNGVTTESVEERMAKLRQDRMVFLQGFCKDFFSIGALHHPVSQPMLDYYASLGAMASLRAMQECMASFSFTDFRQELDLVRVPTLILHGTDDKTVPFEHSGEETAKRVPNNKLIYYQDAPHGLFFTHREQLNKDLIEFLKQKA